MFSLIIATTIIHSGKEARFSPQPLCLFVCYLVGFQQDNAKIKEWISTKFGVMIKIKQTRRVPITFWRRY